jgi:hypothetical protein
MIQKLSDNLRAVFQVQMIIRAPSLITHITVMNVSILLMYGKSVSFTQSGKRLGALPPYQSKPVAVPDISVLPQSSGDETGNP